jgi:hypothetical protein
MTAKDILAFQFGRADAIRTVALSSSAIWTGIVLVLLTAFARNYDQTYIPEKPFLWFFGPLLFSLVSGTWLFLITYGLCARLKMPDVDYARRPPLWRHWPGFMGAFWMTAPIAWLYAIPVERFFDSLTAAKANIALLAIVSLWRVLLMARVFQVICRVPYALALLWVLAAAFVEVLAVTFFGGAFGKSLMASMGGMRNSPEENVLLNALGFASIVSFWGCIIAFVALLIWRWRGTAHEWPALARSRMPLWFLAPAAAAWMLVALLPQRELKNNHAIDQFIAAGQFREAIDFMNRHSAGDFSPSKELPVKLYEFETVEQVFALAAVIRKEDAGWVRQCVNTALQTAIGHLARWWHPRTPLDEVDPGLFHHGIDRYDLEPRLVIAVLDQTNRPPEIFATLIARTNLLIALKSLSADPPIIKNRTSQYPETEQRADWRQLGLTLEQWGYTNSVATEWKGLVR